MVFDTSVAEHKSVSLVGFCGLQTSRGNIIKSQKFEILFSSEEIRGCCKRGYPQIYFMRQRAKGNILCLGVEVTKSRSAKTRLLATSEGRKAVCEHTNQLRCLIQSQGGHQSKGG